MRTARVLLWLMLALAAIAAAIYALRLPLAGYGARVAMEGAGLENPRLKVTALSFKTIRLENVAAGPEGAEGFLFDAIEAQFRLGRLLSSRAVDSLAMGPGTVRMRISPDGEVSIPGVAMPSGGGSGDGADAPLPFERLSLTGVALIVDAPEGGAAGTVTADYDIDEGGRVLFSAASEMTKWNAFRAENASADLDLRLEADGRARLFASVSGDLFTPDGVLRAASVALEGEGASWRAAAAGARDALSFRGRIAIDNAEVPLEQARALSSLAASPWASAALGEAMRTVSVSGGAFADIAPGRIVLTLNEAGAPAALRADTGAALTLTAQDGAPLFVLDGEGMRASLAYRLEGAPLNAEGVFHLKPLADGWRIEAPARLGAFSSRALTFDAAEIDFAAEALPETLRADIALKTLIRKAAIGPAMILEAPIDAAFAATADLAHARARIGVAGACLSLPRLRIDVDAPAVESAFSGAAFCPQGEELAVIDWSDGFNLTAEGVLTAQDARLRVGETAAFAGAPPRIDGAVRFDAAAGESRLGGDFAGGQVTFNDMLILSQADGVFTLSLGAEGMRGEALVGGVRVAQNLEAPLVAPVTASGAGRLIGNIASFDYALRTPDGAPLGAGRGAHDLESGSGEASFDIAELTFTPGGLQPETLTPVLRGVVDSATGVASGAAQFAWAPETLTSSAEIALNDITFGGPTRVVSQTRGVNGNLRFSSLWPVATDGEQTITVTGVDLDALALEEGEIVFDLPGDDTLRIARAAFPWFGGRIGVYDATASFAGGGAALAPLRAESVDLKQMLEYVNVNGLSGEGLLSGVLPLVVEDGKASIEGGFLQSDGSGAIRYQSAATDQASAAGDQAQVAFDLLRDLRYDSLSVAINGPLDGRLSFQLRFEGDGEMAVNEQDVRVPVTYNINLDAALLELLNQANLTRDIQLQFERGLGAEDGEDAAKE